jgi:hypothetical protein
VFKHRFRKVAPTLLDVLAHFIIIEQTTSFLPRNPNAICRTVALHPK